MNTQKINPLLTAEVVGSYLRHHKVDAGQLPDLIATVPRSIGQLGRQPPVEKPIIPAVSCGNPSVRQAELY